MPDEDTLKDVKLYLSRVLRSYARSPRYEDALQEGLLYAWRDIESGKYENDAGYIFLRARQRATAHIQKVYERTTGSPALDREGKERSGGRAAREKISAYMDEFWALHDRAPVAREVGAALGMSKQSATEHMRKLKTGQYSHAIYEDYGGANRLARSYFTTRSIDEMDLHPDGSVKEKQEWLIDGKDSVQEAEDRLDFERLLSQLSDHTHRVLHMVFVLGYNYTEVAEAVGYTSHTNSYGSRVVLKAVAEARELLYPSPPTPAKTPSEYCRKGHKRTEESTKRYKLKNGKTRIKCAICEKAAQAERQKNTPPKVPKSKAELCQRGHKIDGLRGNGTRFCRTCNLDGAKRRKKAKAEEET